MTIQFTNHLAIRHVLTIQLLDTSGNRMPTVVVQKFSSFQKKKKWFLLTLRRYLIAFNILSKCLFVTHKSRDTNSKMGEFDSRLRHVKHLQRNTKNSHQMSSKLPAIKVLIKHYSRDPNTRPQNLDSFETQT